MAPSSNRDIAKGAAAGALAGFAGSWAMNVLMAGVASLLGAPAGAEPSRAAREWQEKADPTGEASDRIARRALGHGLSLRQRDLARPVVHYAFGTTAGAAYGALAETYPQITAGSGIPFAIALWILGDEIGNPVFGLSAPPNKIPLSSHVAQFTAHLAYGFVLETTRRSMRERSRQTAEPLLGVA